MLKFFIMVFEGFTWFTTLSARVATWFSSLASFAMFSTAIRIFLYSLFYAFILLFIASAVAFFYFMVTNIVTAYNLISFFINYIGETSSSGDSIVSATFYFLTITGIVDGVKAFFPFLASSLLFILMKSLYKVALFFYIQVMRTLGVIINVV